MSRRSRCAGMLLAVAGLLLGSPGVASAHVLRGQYANNWETAVTSVSPDVAALTATATADGQSVSIAYSGTQTLVVYGYFHEPYLRITPAGVDQNTNSPSVDLNQSQNISNLGDGSGLNKAPAWQHISDLRVATWHDHRVHWMNNDPPPVAQKDPGHNHLVETWKIDLSVGATPVVVNGTLTWLAWGAGSKLPLVIGVAGTLLAIAVVVLVVRRRRSATSAVGNG